MPKHRVGARSVEETAVVIDDDARFGLLVDVEPDRYVGLVPHVPFALGEIAAERGKKRVPRAALVVHEALEKRHPGRNLAPPLYPGQGTVLERARCDMLGSELLEKGYERLPFVDRAAHGKRIDEHADNRAGVIDRHPAASPDRRENDIVRAGISREDDGPRRLKTRVERAAVLLRERLEHSLDAWSDDDFFLAVALLRLRQLRGVVRYREGERSRETFEKLPPEFFRPRRVLLLQPVDVRPVRRRRPERHARSSERRFIDREGLFEDHGA
jgi:hypothetical protein